MTFAVIRVRGSLNIKPEIKETLRLLRLNRVNHCVLLPQTPEYVGMIRKVKDYVTWGEVDQEIMEKLIGARGRTEGDRPIDEKVIRERSDFKSIKEMSSAIIEGSFQYSGLDGVKPIFRLPPPRKGGYEGIKRSFVNGGALGYRGDKINALLDRMI